MIQTLTIRHFSQDQMVKLGLSGTVFLIELTSGLLKAPDKCHVFFLFFFIPEVWMFTAPMKGHNRFKQH